jgi:4-oxalocrotonate tautomerase
MPILNVTISRKPDADLVKKIAQGLVERTERVLGKRRDVTSVAIHFVAPEHWVVGGHTLDEQKLSSFWLDIKVTEGTNTKDEKATYLAEVFSFMGSVLGALHGESYILVDEVRADAYGYGGRTQEQRYVQSRIEMQAAKGAASSTNENR